MIPVPDEEQSRGVEFWLAIAVGLVTGAAVGAAAGYLIDSIVVGTSLGMGLGLVLGSRVGRGMKPLNLSLLARRGRARRFD